MGEVAEMMLDGTLCATCGEVFDDVESDDFEPRPYPRWCEECADYIRGEVFVRDGAGWRLTVDELERPGVYRKRT